MRKVFRFTMLIINVMGVIILNSCDDNYDPIGNNKPSPLLKIAPLELSFNGVGGEVSATLSTNAEILAIGEAPEWIESATLSDDYKSITIKAKPNTNPALIRMGTLAVSTQTGSNEAVQYMKFVQAAQNAVITYESFSGSTIPSSWVLSDQSKITMGSGYLNIVGNAATGGETALCKQSSGLITQANNVVTAYVDVKGGEGGLKVYMGGADENVVFEFFYNFNSATNKGSVFAFKSGGPMALGDEVPGPGMPAMPGAGEKDDYFRVEVTNSAKMPNWWQSELNIYSLKTSNGETKVLQKHFSRQFEFDGPKPNPGYVAIWGRGETCAFKNFTISAQNN